MESEARDSGEQLLGVAAIQLEALGLKVRAAITTDLRALVPVDAEPAQTFEDDLERLRGRPRPVGVLDPQDERTTRRTGGGPVVDRGARAADVQRPGRRGGI